MSSLSVVFISDVHVAPAGSVEPFLDFLRTLPGRARALFILGDLFDLWTGHADADQPENRLVLAALDELQAAGVAVTFVAGNRDIYLHDYLQRTARFPSHPDDLLLALDGKRLMVCHGDLLCRRDRGHLFLRRGLGWKPFRFLFLRLPARVQRFLAQRLRRHSERVSGAKDPATFAVDDAALGKLFARGLDVIVCGHTHRPEHRVLTVDGRRCELFVLDPWIDHPGYLEYRDGSFTSRLLGADKD